MKLLLFGEGAPAAQSLRRLVQEGYELSGVVISAKPKDAALQTAARELELAVFQPARVNESDFLAEVRDLQPDLCLSIAYNQIFQRPILELVPLGFVNFHPGRLPDYRGRHVISWAMINGETEIGLTAHYADEGIDTGNIILQKTVPVAWSDSCADVERKVTTMLPQLVVEAVGLIDDGQAKARPQNHLSGTYFPRLDYADLWLDWSDSSLNLYNKIRALSRPGLGARTLIHGQEVIVWQARYDPAWPVYKMTPGRVVGQIPNEGVLVKTGDSTMLVREIQYTAAETQKPAWRTGTRLGVDFSYHLRRLQARVEILEQAINDLDLKEPAAGADEITDKLLIVLQQHLRSSNDGQAFPMDTELGVLGLDSLKAVDLLLGLEDTFEITFPDSMLTEETFRTASTLRDAIQTLVNS
jgi:methionyl-tRNA formyltransferase